MLGVVWAVIGVEKDFIFFAKSGKVADAWPRSPKD
jgi:hypothetical protein